MANVISDETMEYVGILAKLELKDEEKESARQDMQKMLEWRRPRCNACQCTGSQRGPVQGSENGRIAGGD